MRPKPVAYFLCAVSLILIAVCPLMLQSGNDAMADAAPYKGILTLWHITRWRTGGSSFEAFLSKRISEFEADSAYTFIELKSLTAGEAAQALAEGQAPDLISYPLGCNPGVTLQSLPSANSIIPDTGEGAWPYMCGGYCILVNTDLLTDQGAELPENGWGLRPEALVDAAQYGTHFDAEPGCSGLPVLAFYQYPESTEPNMSTWGEPEPPEAMLSLAPDKLDSGLDAFLSGECAVLIASHRQLFEAGQAYSQGEGPAFFAYAIGGYTDMVQMIGVAACGDETKLSACAAFAQYLVSDGVQRKIEYCGALPVMTDLDIYAQDECRRAMYTLLCEDAALPDADEAHMLNILAARALGGDESALKELRAQLHG